MTTAAAASIPARAAGPLSRWQSVQHPLHTEAAVVLALYGLYEVARGLVVGNAAEAARHTRHLAATERSLHLLVAVRSHVEFGSRVAQQNSWAEGDADLQPSARFRAGSGRRPPSRRRSGLSWAAPTC
jgi:hypothetical protein